MALRIPTAGIPPDVLRAIKRRGVRLRKPNFNLLIGSLPQAPVAAGTAAAGVTAGIQALHQVQRANLLSQGLASGAIKAQTLSGVDQNLLATVTPPAPTSSTKTPNKLNSAQFSALSPDQKAAYVKLHLGNQAGGIGGFFENLLGERGLYGAVTHLPQGIYTSAKDLGAVGLAAAGLHNDPNAVSRLNKEVIKPVVAGYKYSYKPLFEGHPGTFLKHFYQQPFGPVMDIATLASGGAGVAGRVGLRLAPEGRAASLISREGRGGVPRAPVRITHDMAPHAVQQLGESIPAIPRMYSPRPLRHVAQLAADRIVAGGLGARRIPGISKSLQDLQQFRAINRWSDKTYAQQVMESQLRARLASTNFVKSLNKLDPAEQTALHFAMRGVNDRALMSVAQDYWSKSLAGTNPEGHNLADFAGVPHEYVQHLANLPDNVVNLVEHPTQGMVDSANLWHVFVEEARKEAGVPDEIHAARIVQTNRSLNGLGDTPLTPEELQQIIGGDLSKYKPPPNEAGVEYPINPTYVPDMPASNMKFGQQRSGSLSFLARRLGVSGKDYVLSPGERKIQITRTGPDTIIRPPFQAYLKTSDLGTFHSGAFRTDAKALVDHITKFEEDVVHQIYNQKRIDTMALKDEHGEARSFRSQDEVNHTTGGGYTFVPLDGTIRWFQAENNVLKQAVERMQELEQHGQLGSPEMLDQLNRLLETNAKDFVNRDLMAVRNPGIAVPTQFAKRMEAVFKSRDPFLGNFYQKLINKWRTWTLAYMPRWWINTAVGSAVLNGIKGVWNPRDYIEAKRLLHSGKLPAGVHLGGFAEHEALEGPSGLLNAGRTTRGLYRMVENLESYFRTASFVHSLKKEHRMAMRGIGKVLEGYKPVMRSEMKHSDFIDHLLENPTLVEHAIDDVNQFAYNMSELGPVERRYVRAFVPFWGWYKFITKLVWRLPVDYPGRTLILTKLGDIGQNQEAQLGPLPDWMKGSLFLNHDKSHLSFLPTRGLNPFAQFANPFSPAGTVQGLMSWGQLSPVIQAAVAGAGVDTLTGGPSSISPEENVGFDFWGNPIDVTNGKVLENVGQKAGFRRAVGTFFRSFPQIRNLEVGLAGGNPVYPESIPIFDERPVAVNPQSRKSFDVGGLLGQATGISPRTTDLIRTQQLNEKRIRYGAQTLRRQKRQRQDKLKQP